MKTLSFILLSASKEAKGGSGDYTMFIMLGLIMVVFYFFMIRPQVKKQKEAKNFRASLKAGDKIVTIGGIYGKIVEVKENYIIIEIDKEVKIKVDKNAVIKDFSQVEQKR